MSSDRFTIDHLVPQSLGGSDEPDNLALACTRCNQRRYNFTTGIDPVTQQEIPLFNPRNQKWADHFIWTVDGLKILGITPTGRATCDRLDLNADPDKTWVWRTGFSVWECTNIAGNLEFDLSSLDKSPI